MLLLSPEAQLPRFTNDMQRDLDLFPELVPASGTPKATGWAKVPKVHAQPTSTAWKHAAAPAHDADVQQSAPPDLFPGLPAAAGQQAMNSASAPASVNDLGACATALAKKKKATTPAAFAAGGDDRVGAVFWVSRGAATLREFPCLLVREHVVERKFAIQGGHYFLCVKEEIVAGLPTLVLVPLTSQSYTDFKTGESLVTEINKNNFARSFGDSTKTTYVKIKKHAQFYWVKKDAVATWKVESRCDGAAVEAVRRKLRGKHQAADAAPWQFA